MYVIDSNSFAVIKIGNTVLHFRTLINDFLKPGQNDYIGDWCAHMFTVNTLLITVTLHLL